MEGQAKQRRRSRHRAHGSQQDAMNIQPSAGLHCTDMILSWTRKSYITNESEKTMIDYLLRYGKRERGMMNSQNRKRVHFIRKKCIETKMELLTALSLRRNYMKMFNPFLNHERLGLGPEHKIRESAEIFERRIQGYLELQNIPFEDEQTQRQRAGKRVATPDFLFHEPISLQVTFQGSTKAYTIHWLEVKMFYGANTIPPDGKSAVGSILKKSQIYRNLFGTGAIVFLQGCGERLAKSLDKMGVVALDPDPQVNLEPLWIHMRTWCADSDGNILP